VYARPMFEYFWVFGGCHAHALLLQTAAPLKDAASAFDQLGFGRPQRKRPVRPAALAPAASAPTAAFGKRSVLRGGRVACGGEAGQQGECRRRQLSRKRLHKRPCSAPRPPRCAVAEQ